jgi:hypothetical protein
MSAKKPAAAHSAALRAQSKTMADHVPWRLRPVVR